MKSPVPVGALRGMLKEIQASGKDEKPLVVGGARELAVVLRKELGRGAAPGGVGAGDEPSGAAVLVYVLGGEPGDADVAALKRARRARVPIVAVVAGRVDEDVSIPYVLATDVIRVRAGEGFLLDAIARAVAARLGEDGAPLAAHVPALRGAVCDRLIAAAARKNGLVAAAVFVPGADMPILARNQVRLVLRLEQAYGLELDARARAPEIAGVLAAGLGLRAAAEQLLDLVPVAGWLVKGAVAYAGTRTLGEATVRRLEARAPGRHGSLRPPQA